MIHPFFLILGHLYVLYSDECIAYCILLILGFSGRKYRETETTLSQSRGYLYSYPLRGIYFPIG